VSLSQAGRAVRRRRLAVGLRILFVAAAAGLAIYAVGQDLEGFFRSLRDVGVGRVAGSWALVTAGVLLSSVAWSRLVSASAGPLPTPTARRVFFVTQLGKYLPGALWTVLGQVAAGSRHRLSRSAVAVAAVLFILIHIVTGLVLSGTIALRVAPGLPDDRYRWLLLTGPVAALALWPPLLNRLVSVSLHILRAPQLDEPLRTREVLRPCAFLLGTWCLYGASTAALSTAFHGDIGPVDMFLLGTSVFALAWVAGVLVLPAPAGVGVREVAIFAGLAPVIGGTPAVSVSIILRVVHTLADLALAALALGPWGAESDSGAE
jgi:glycosyltransferase 2 family protein